MINIYYPISGPKLLQYTAFKRYVLSFNRHVTVSYKRWLHALLQGNDFGWNRREAACWGKGPLKTVNLTILVVCSCWLGSLVHTKTVVRSRFLVISKFSLCEFSRWEKSGGIFLGRPFGDGWETCLQRALTVNHLLKYWRQCIFFSMSPFNSKTLTINKLVLKSLKLKQRKWNSLLIVFSSAEHKTRRR